MNLSVQYRLFIHVNERLIAEEYDRYEILKVREDINPDDMKDFKELSELLGKAIHRPVNEFKMKSFKVM
ncbi:hypothetical protein [Peribacillus muralis]|uniref:hypothetical protein n=1 Tax=Peribacillus muralis TaxID=264697 RepID=UPI000708F387|nr:hypothetical protein [Peribacillus muralis]MCK1993523.1 hypothetical protein [Peribacillus muralis]MCK2014189.1 hypothetical protein [Peribacillus muralis]